MPVGLSLERELLRAGGSQHRARHPEARWLALPLWLVGQRGRSLLRATMTQLSKAHRRWLKRLVSGKVPDAEWPLGIDRRGRLRSSDPGQPVPPIKIISEAEARECTRRPLPLP